MPNKVSKSNPEDMEQPYDEGVLTNRLVITLEHDTEEGHRATLKRAKDKGLSYVWSGDVRRNQYLAENLRFGEEAGILTTKFVESDQESGWKIYWSNSENHVYSTRSHP